REEVHDPAESLRERSVGAALLGGAALDDGDLAELRERLELAEEPALSDARLAGDEDEALGRSSRGELDAGLLRFARGSLHTMRAGLGRVAEIELDARVRRGKLALLRGLGRVRRGRRLGLGALRADRVLEAADEERELLLAAHEAAARDPERGRLLGLDL